MWKLLDIGSDGSSLYGVRVCGMRVLEEYPAIDTVLLISYKIRVYEFGGDRVSFPFLVPVQSVSTPIAAPHAYLS